MRKTNYDFLNKCTKEELIFFIKQNGYVRQLFSWSDVLRMRWDKKSKSLLDKQRVHGDKLGGVGLKKRDDIARQFNSEKDIKKKVELLNKMQPYQKKLEEWWLEDKKLKKEQEKVDALFYELQGSYIND